MSAEFKSEVNDLKGDIDQLEDRDTRGEVPLNLIGSIAEDAVEICETGANFERLDTLSYERYSTEREYYIYRCDSFDGNSRLGRPVNNDLFIRDTNELEQLWSEVSDELSGGDGTLPADKVDQIVYTIIQSVGAAIDISSRGRDRKTLGSFFEHIVGIFLSEMTGNDRGTSITLECDGVSTTIPIDLHLKSTNSGDATLAVPVKTSTRERMVQIWADHMLLERLSDQEEEHRTILISVGELQRRGQSLQETCSPAKVGVYQRHLAQIDGLYYLDPPLRYLNAGFAEDDEDCHLPVRRFSSLLTEDLPNLIS